MADVQAYGSHDARAGPSRLPDIIEFTKDGNISRMRSHKGNIPSLPQNKLCPLCPAKFTRTTHLNRHLRTHSNERMHECERCHSQFTRSDLLSRHKRNCGDSNPKQRSRRKSCQACAESKIKCDQQQPCSKCKTRGRECIYPATPLPTSGRKPKKTTQAESTPSREGSTSESLSPPPDPSSMSSRDSTTSTPSIGAYDSFDPLPSHSDRSILPPELAPYPPPYPPALSNHSSSIYSGSVTEYSTEVDASSVSFAHEALEVQGHLNALFSNEMFDKFFSNFETGGGGSHGGLQSNASTNHQHDSLEVFSQDSQFPFPTAVGEPQPFMASVASFDFGVPHAPSTNVVQAQPMYAGRIYNTFTPPAPAELQYYLHLFLTNFLEQMPIMHPPTFSVVSKPAILISAMQAAGALYVKTAAAANFITHTLDSAREEIVTAFSRIPTTVEDQVHLILAVCILQTIGLFHQVPAQRAQSNIYHAMLVMMIRQSGLLNSNARWVPATFTDPASREIAWRDWVCYETTKRALSLTFLHDCCHCIYFTLRPTFSQNEFNLRLPCEQGLYNAGNSAEWQRVLTQSSSYGSIEDRLRGNMPMQSALSTLSEIRPPTVPALILTPFSQFILIHGILRKLFEDCLDNGPVSELNLDDVEAGRINLTIQFMLHNWLQSWLQSPESPKRSPTGEDPPFFNDGLPLYWIGQVLLLAYQEGLPPFTSVNGTGDDKDNEGSLYTSGEAKFSLMREWFKQVRGFLRRGEQGPTLFWDELMKIRLKNCQAKMITGGAPGDADGLLGFFPNQ